MPRVDVPVRVGDPPQRVARVDDRDERRRLSELADVAQVLALPAGSATANLGRRRPKWNRAYQGVPRRARLSTIPTVAAWTRTSTSSSLGTGFGTSSTVTTSGEP